ncbi:MAG TPA: substrate-binding domain-containing protein [Acidimicrobiales bacterium]
MFVAAGLVLAGCGGDDGGDSSDGGGAGGDGAELGVQTIPELQPVVEELLTAYNETAGDTLRVTVGDATEVAQAAQEGQPAVLPGPWLAEVGGESIAIGRGLAVIVVPEGNPGQVSGVEAFAPDAGLSTVACGPDSSVGNFTAAVMQRGGIQAPVVDSSEQCAADAVARVASGELDAAIFFRNGVELPQGVEVVPIPDDQNLVIDVHYLPRPGGDDFGAFLGSEPAAQILTTQGYLP